MLNFASGLQLPLKWSPELPAGAVFTEKGRNTAFLENLGPIWSVFYSQRPLFLKIKVINAKLLVI